MTNTKQTVEEEVDEQARVPCATCAGEGKIPIGEHLVTLEMAIDAGDMNLHGTHHSFEYGACPGCDGDGLDQDYRTVAITKATALRDAEEEIEKLRAEVDVFGGLLVLLLTRL